MVLFIWNVPINYKYTQVTIVLAFKYVIVLFFQWTVPYHHKNSAD